MKIYNFLVDLIISIILVESYYIKDGPHTNITLNNFAFGSCYRPYLKKNTEIFKTVLESDPEMWIWLGDATYLDFFTFNYLRRDFGFNPVHVEEKFNQTKYNQYYNRLSQTLPVIGVWDDHDFGMNDSNRHFRFKESIKKYYLDFLDEPENSPRRRIGDGIYTTYSFGDLNTHKTVRFILLDVRHEKDSIYLDKNPDMLGNKQWTWLEETLKNANETFIFIVSGTQILPFNRLATECWYPLSRERLFNLIAKYNKNGVVFLSGDIHMAEILKTFCTLPEIGYNIYEITSSGLSHYAWFSVFVEDIFANDYSITPFIKTYNFAKIDFMWGNNRNESKFNVSIIDFDGNTRASLGINYQDISYRKIEEIIESGERNCRSKLTTRFKSFNEYLKYYTENPLALLPIIIFVFTLFSLLAIGLYICSKIIKFIFKSIMRYRKVKDDDKKIN